MVRQLQSEGGGLGERDKKLKKLQKALRQIEELGRRRRGTAAREDAAE